VKINQKNWITFDGEPIGGHLPATIEVYPSSSVMTPVQEGWVANSYQLFCDVVRNTPNPSGYHVQNRTAIDGSKLRMESNNGQHTVRVWPAGGEEEPTTYRGGIGVVLVQYGTYYNIDASPPVDGPPIDHPMLRYETSPGVYVEQPLVLRPKIYVKNAKSTGEWRIEKVPKLVANTVAWVDKPRRRWLSYYAPVPLPAQDRTFATNWMPDQSDNRLKRYVCTLNDTAILMPNETLGAEALMTPIIGIVNRGAGREYVVAQLVQVSAVTRLRLWFRNYERILDLEQPGAANEVVGTTPDYDQPTSAFTTYLVPAQLFLNATGDKLFFYSPSYNFTTQQYTYRYTTIDITNVPLVTADFTFTAPNYQAAVTGGWNDAAGPGLTYDTWTVDATNLTNSGVFQVGMDANRFWWIEQSVSTSQAQTYSLNMTGDYEGAVQWTQSDVFLQRTNNSISKLKHSITGTEIILLSLQRSSEQTYYYRRDSNDFNISWTWTQTSSGQWNFTSVSRNLILWHYMNGLEVIITTRIEGTFSTSGAQNDSGTQSNNVPAINFSGWSAVPSQVGYLEVWHNGNRVVNDAIVSAAYSGGVPFMYGGGPFVIRSGTGSYSANDLPTLQNAAHQYFTNALFAHTQVAVEPVSGAIIIVLSNSSSLGAPEIRRQYLADHAGVRDLRTVFPGLTLPSSSICNAHEYSQNSLVTV